MNEMRLQVSAKSSQCVSNIESAYRHTDTQLGRTMANATDSIGSFPSCISVNIYKNRKAEKTSWNKIKIDRQDRKNEIKRNGICNCKRNASSKIK